MTTPARILIVCTANQCRSPLAEVIAQALLDARGIDALVRSAGTDAVDGVEATDKSAELARRRELDLSRHQSRRITAEDAEDADLIITMENRHAGLIVHEWPATAEKTFVARDLQGRVASQPRAADQSLAGYLAELAADRPLNSLLDQSRRLDIADPIGRPMRAYKKCERQLDEVLGDIFAGIYPSGSTDAPDD